MKKLLLLFLSMHLVFYGCTNSPKKFQLEGTFISQDNIFYESLTFKGEKTVIIRDAVFGLDFPSEYMKDEEFLHVKTDKTDLVFEIISKDTLKGIGFAEGLFIKE